MDIKSHRKYWYFHKRIWQQEYDSLDNEIRTMVMEDVNGLESKELGKRVDFLVEIELLSNPE